MTVPSWAPCTSTTAPRGSAAPASSALTEVTDSTGLRPALRSGSHFHWFVLDWSSLPCSSWRVLAEARGAEQQVPYASATRRQFAAAPALDGREAALWPRARWAGMEGIPGGSLLTPPPPRAPGSGALLGTARSLRVTVPHTHHCLSNHQGEFGLLTNLH